MSRRRSEYFEVLDNNGVFPCRFSCDLAFAVPVKRVWIDGGFPDHRDVFFQIKEHAQAS